MSLKQNLLTMIVAILFAITTAMGDTANTPALATNLSLSTNATTNATTNGLVALDPTDMYKIGCTVANHEKAYLKHYDEVVDHLRNMAGNATLYTQPGGSWCFRYSCAWNLGIYACNDGQDNVQVPWATIAAYADEIKARCTTKRRVNWHWMSMAVGQAFDKGDWNVILGLRSGDYC